MAGRKPVPTALKILRGNPGRRPLNQNEPSPTVGVPAPLKALTPAGRRHYRDLSARLSAVRVLTENDGPALSALAQSIADYEEATRELAENGRVLQGVNGPVRSPWAILQKQALDQMQRGFTDFGLSPVARAKISAVPQSTADDAEALFG
jgi:P27 family predicted phage terminase small subunit